ncbi:MAG: hypothetical protein IPM23_03880 [Candidatus Melainabacteria bacterium]|nr:hypothetical protein [Candidatus Melainabacteria bacterium]
MSKENTLRPRVQVDERGCLLFVVSHGQVAPAAFTNLVTCDRGELKAAREVVRIAGGCKHFSQDLLDNLIPYFVDAFRQVDAEGKTTREFRGTAFSGGTANVDGEGGLKNDMVTNVPAHLAAAYPCIAMSTTPRTGDMALEQKHGGLVVDLYGGRIDFRQQAALVYQQDPATVLDWDGDLALYLTLMEGWQMAGFKTAVIAMNGGDVTRDEIYGALKRRIPVIAVEGSLRETDAFIAAFRDGDWSKTAAEMREKLAGKKKDTKPADDAVAAAKAVLEKADRSLVSIVPINDSKALREALVSRGFLS